MSNFPFRGLPLGDIHPIITPVDLQTAANTGVRLNVSEYERVFIVLFKGIGTAGQDPVFTPLQHDAVTSGNSKAISITSIWSKLDDTEIAGLDAWTETTQSAADTYTDATSAEKLGLIVLEVDTADLDTANGYKYISLDIPDVGGSAQIGCAFAVLTGKRYAGVATNVAA